MTFACVKSALHHMQEVHLEERPNLCPNAEDGCPWAFKRKSHQQHHSNICKYKKVTLFLSVTETNIANHYLMTCVQ
jgi:hypothetical protein